MKERATFANELLSENYFLSPLLTMMKKHLEKSGKKILVKS